MKFKDIYSSSLDVASNPGSPFRITYKLTVDDDGVQKLVQIGKENLYEYIQSHADSCDINLIMERFGHDQEMLTERLNSRRGEYLDLCEMPTNYAEVLQRVIDGEVMFNTLPTHVKTQFDNSYTKFIAAIGTEEWNSIFMPEKPEQPLQSVSSDGGDVE